MIPTLDWQEFAKGTDRQGFVQTLSKALRGPGMFRLSGHGVDPGLIEQTFEFSCEVFDLTEAEKRTFSVRAGPHNRGWARQGSEQLGCTEKQPERRESFNIGLDLPATDPRVAAGQPFRSVNLWPSIPGFRETVLDYFDAVLELGIALHRAIAIDLDLPEHHFDSMFDDPLATLRLLSYPPGTGARGETGAGAHTDYGSISLLLTDSEPGLEVQLRNGEWVDVAPMRDRFIVLVGDCMEHWTGGTYVATPHRVRIPANRRHALNFYLDPSPEVTVAPLPGMGKPGKRPPTAAEFLARRLARAKITPPR